MKLKEFKDIFPNLYQAYEATNCSRQKKVKPIDRLVEFIESRKDVNIRLINNPKVEYKNLFRPIITINGVEKTYDVLLSLSQSKSFLVGKAIEYLGTGRIY